MWGTSWSRNARLLSAIAPCHPVNTRNRHGVFERREINHYPAYHSSRYFFGEASNAARDSVSAQDADQPLIAEVEHDESLVLADRLGLLSILSPLLPYAKKFQDVPLSPPLVKTASPIIDRKTRDVEVAFFFDELLTDILLIGLLYCV
ncbi:hypothetical protein BDN71DRAFT_1441579 [Pleurotus eryngii]|uniref:Uncharacterized protein n=1 Tax=Pleurotus eryngii TaxID=5323 RepID=A0A9P6A3R4_PLEER|nr:hypothetical protein BDN71DRAFT_1441579 [Pleurotus eryngii]